MCRFAEINDKIQILIGLTEIKWKVTLPDIQVRFDLRGKSAGQAIKKYNREQGKFNYSMRFNVDMINNKGFDHIINETVPHELAHIICMYMGWDKGHGKYWKSVCRQLGGTGKRCHNEEVTPVRITQQFLYKTTCGKTIKVSKIRHNKIQKGKVYKMIDTGGFLIKDSWSVLEA